MDDKFFEIRVLVIGAITAFLVGLIYTLVFGMKQDLDVGLLTVMSVAFCLGVKLALDYPPKSSKKKSNDNIV